MPGSTQFFKNKCNFAVKLKTLLNSSFTFSKTRIAPTPSGFLHLGNILSFVITSLIARKSNALILLRVDDLDQARTDGKYLREIFDTLDFLEIPWNEGPLNAAEFETGYSQLNRMELYKTALMQLAADGKVFACGCSRKQLLQHGSCNCINLEIPLTTENTAWRLITGNNHPLMVKTIKGESVPFFLPSVMQHFIVKKKDGFPAYQLTSLMDDLFYGVDLVVRGQDLWPSTLAQQELARALGKNRFADIAFYHHPLLLTPDGAKLSKSAGATSIKHLRENGKKPADIFTLIAAMLNINETPANWQQLGEAFFNRIEPI